MDKQSGNGVLEEFRIEFLDCWQRLPNKGFFLGLLVAWLALFQFLGNATLGYAPTPSLLYWMLQVYTARPTEQAEAEEAYGLAVPFVVLFLFWVKRKELLKLELRAWWPGLFLVALGAGLHLLGYRVQQPRISILGLFTGLYGLTGLAWGWAWMRRSFFPFFLFGLCIPLGSLAIPITFRLQLLVCKLVEFVCVYILQIDINVVGTQIFDPSGRYQYEVAAACSGIRSLFATMGFGLVLGFVSLRQWWKRLAMVAAAVPLAVLGNLLRMLAIVLAAEMGGQAWGNFVHDKELLVLLLYVPAFAGLLFLERYLREPSAASRTPVLAPKQV